MYGDPRSVPVTPTEETSDMATTTASHTHRYSKTTGYCSCGNSPLGKLTDAQRQAKLARAAKLAAQAAELMGELYDDRKDSTYRMDYRTEQLHRGIARAADAAERAATTLRGELDDHAAALAL